MTETPGRVLLVSTIGCFGFLGAACFLYFGFSLSCSKTRLWWKRCRETKARQGSARIKEWMNDNGFFLLLFVYFYGGEGDQWHGMAMADQKHSWLVFIKMFASLCVNNSAFSLWLTIILIIISSNLTLLYACFSFLSLALSHMQMHMAWWWRYE